MNKHKHLQFWFISFLIPVIFIPFSCTKRVDIKKETDELMQLSREWSKVAAEGNVEKTLDYWTDDATFILPRQQPIKTKDNLRSMLQASYQMPGFKISWEPQSVVISECGDMAYMIEKSQASINDSTGHPIIEYHKTVKIWRKEPSGQWKNVIDIWTDEEKK
jgi:ketosteroid isomerase-like protein